MVRVTARQSGVPGPPHGLVEQGPADAAAAVVGQDRELVDVGAAVDDVDADEADGRVAGGEHRRHLVEPVVGVLVVERPDPDRLEEPIGFELDLAEAAELGGRRRSDRGQPVSHG